MNSQDSLRKQREDWVASLQVEDEVALQGTGYSRYWYVYRVVKITPSGRVNLSNGIVINPDGSIRGDSCNYAYPVTDKVRASIWRRRAIDKIRTCLVIERLSDNNLNRLLQILKEHEEQDNQL